MNFFSKIQGYRTLVFNGAIALSGALFGHDALAAVTNLTGSIDTAIAAIVGVISAGNLALRAVTTSPILSGAVHVETTPVALGEEPTVTKNS